MKSFIFVIGAVLLITQAAFAVEYDEWNLAELQKNYAKAVADPVPWSGFWWPYIENGIDDATYDTASNMSATDKIDAMFGAKNWASSWEYSHHGQGVRAPDWWGHCNGWAAAAIMEAEPRSSKTINGIEFKVHDRKALLTEYWMEFGNDFIGHRVNNPHDFSSSAFWDVVPAAFHLLLTNIVGKEKRSLILDRYTGAEVWNQPLVAYEVHPIKPEDYLGPDPRYRNVYRVNVTTTIYWAEDDVEPDSVTPEFKWADGDYFSKRTLHYELWLDGPMEFDSKGNIVSSGDIILNGSVGGRWKNGSNPQVLVHTHPDFMWIPLVNTRSTGYKNPRIHEQWVHENMPE